MSAEYPSQKARICNAIKTGKEYIADIKIKRHRRSLDANAYFWVLCDRLAEETRDTEDRYIPRGH